MSDLRSVQQTLSTHTTLGYHKQHELAVDRSVTDNGRHLSTDCHCLVPQVVAFHRSNGEQLSILHRLFAST